MVMRCVYKSGGRAATPVSAAAMASLSAPSLVCLLPLLLLLWWSEQGEARALFGSLLSSLASQSSGNGTSLLQLLVLEHLQDKLDKLAQFGELLGLGANSTLIG